MKKTEYKLTLWREGNPNAERFCADILLIDGFNSVDPQSPLGGPDGLKDIVCEKNGWSYIGASYFATTQKTYASIKRKFVHDLDGVSANNADGIVFMTNQSLTPTQKKALKKIATNQNAKSIIYDNERIRAILDSPIGFSLRLKYLRIKMNKEEQLAFFAHQQSKISQLLSNQSNEIISALSKKIDDCCKRSVESESLISEFLSATQSTLNFVKDAEQLQKSDKKKLDFPTIQTLTVGLTVEELCNIHKLLMYGYNVPDIGKLRTHNVWIGSASGTPDKISYTPPQFEDVPELTENLLRGWRENYQKILKGTKDTKVSAITKFHGDFLSIHPFMDGNGRVARFLLNQQVSELLGIEIKVVVEDKPSYFSALTDSQNGEYENLELIIRQAIFGEE
jgi:fido (protein-threonine AMPylation protein)